MSMRKFKSCSKSYLCPPEEASSLDSCTATWVWKSCVIFKRTVQQSARSYPSQGIQPNILFSMWANGETQCNWKALVFYSMKNCTHFCYPQRESSHLGARFEAKSILSPFEKVARLYIMFIGCEYKEDNTNEVTGLLWYGRDVCSVPFLWCHLKHFSHRCQQSSLVS